MSFSKMSPIFDPQNQAPIRKGAWTPPPAPPAVPREPTEHDRRLRAAADRLVARFGRDTLLAALEVAALVAEHGVADVRSALVAAAGHHNGKGA